MSETEIHHRLEIARKSAGYATAREAAEAMGVAYPSYAAHENGQRGLARSADRYAKFFRVSLDWLIFGLGSAPEGRPGDIPKIGATSAQHDSPNATVRGKLTGQGKMIPVYGRAVGGVDGEFEMNGSILYHVMAPPSLSETRGAYAVQVSGESMSPRYEDGEVCFIDPNRRVRKGDYVVVQIKLEDHGPLLAYVKKFCRRNSEELVLEQFNPPKELRFPERSVESVHFIALAGAA